MNWLKRLFAEKYTQKAQLTQFMVGRTNKELLQLLRDTYERFTNDYHVYQGLCAVANYLYDSEQITYAEYARINWYLNRESVKRHKVNDYWAEKTDTECRFNWLDKTIKTLE